MRKTKKVMAVVLASAMALAMNVSSVFAAAEEFPVGKVSDTVNNGDGTWDVTVSVDASSILKWDIGLVYDSTKLEVVKTEDPDTGIVSDKIVNGESFKKGIDALGGVIQNYVFAEADKSYVVLAGTQPKDAWAFKGGVIATVTFKAKTDDVKEANVILVPQDVTSVFKAADKLNYDSAKAASIGTEIELKDVVVEPTPAPEDPTDAPATDAPATDAPATDAPVQGDPTKAPVDQKPADTAAPAATTATTNTTKSAKTGDTANVVIPMIAICAAAAAVVVASKKKVEE